MSDNYTVSRQSLHLRLLDLLDAGSLEPGDHLPGEVDLAERLHVSRPQLREALRMLEALGVIESRQGARRTWLGFTTSIMARQLVATLKPTPRAVEELLDVRQALEAAMLPRAIVAMTPGDIEALENIANQMVELATDGQTFTAEDEEFHRLILGSLNNELLAGLHAAFWSMYAAYAEHHPPQEDPVPVAEMHLRIAHAIKAGDTRRAVHELDAHYYGVRARLSPHPLPQSATSTADLPGGPSQHTERETHETT